MNKRQLMVNLMAIIIPLVLVSCAKKAPPPPPPQQQQVQQEPDLEHRVQYSGETLGLIARWYTGDTQNWKTIVDHNPGLRPERIALGQVIFIPRGLVSESRPMPKDFVRSVARRSAPTAVRSDEPVNADALSEFDDSGSVTSGSEVGAGSAPSVQQDTTSGATQAGAAPTEVGKEPVKTGTAPAADDAEREKLLDELLQQ